MLGTEKQLQHLIQPVNGKKGARFLLKHRSQFCKGCEWPKETDGGWKVSAEECDTCRARLNTLHPSSDLPFPQPGSSECSGSVRQSEHSQPRPSDDTHQHPLVMAATDTKESKETPLVLMRSGQNCFCFRQICKERCQSPWSRVRLEVIPLNPFRLAETVVHSFKKKLFKRSPETQAFPAVSSWVSPSLSLTLGSQQKNKKFSFS